MKPSAQKILTKLGKEKEKQIQEKVELATSPEIEKYVNMAKDAIKKMNDNFDKLNKILEDVKAQSSELNRQINTAENNYKAGDIIKQNSRKLLNVIKQKADELGVETRQIKNYDKLRELADEAVGVSENLYFLQNRAKGLRGAINKLTS